MGDSLVLLLCSQCRETNVGHDRLHGDNDNLERSAASLQVYRRSRHLLVIVAAFFAPWQNQWAIFFRQTGRVLSHKLVLRAHGSLTMASCCTLYIQVLGNAIRESSLTRQAIVNDGLMDAIIPRGDWPREKDCLEELSVFGSLWQIMTALELIAFEHTLCMLYHAVFELESRRLRSRLSFFSQTFLVIVSKIIQNKEIFYGNAKQG